MGKFASTKQKDFMPAFEYCAERCREEWPDVRWTAKQISDKYFNEQKRYRAFRNLLAFSGASYNESTGLVECSRDTFEGFLKRHGQKYAWLKTKPLGDKAVYEKVFWRERGTGSHIREPGEPPVRVRDVASASALSTPTDEGDENVPARQPNTPLSLAQKRRLENDPDCTPLSSADRDRLRLIEVREQKKPKTEAALLAESIGNGAFLISRPKVPGAGDLEEAVKDIQARYREKLTTLELVRCIEKLQSESTNPVVWNALEEESKDILVAEWKLI